MELIFAYGAGLLTLVNPCVLPILPILLAASLQTGRHGPVLIATGMSLTFVTLGVAVTAFGAAVGVTEETVSKAGALLMFGFGLVLLVPQFSARFASATAGLGHRADAGIDAVGGTGPVGQVITGALMGLVWSPCIGPTLGAAIGLASQGQNLGWVTAIMAFFALGVSTIILALGYGARSVILKRQQWMRAIAEKSRPVLGAVFVFMGVATWFHWPRIVEAWAVETMPAWLLDLSVSL